MIRLGLCCAFRDQPIRFRTTTAAAMLRLSRKDRLSRIADLIRANAGMLHRAVQYCAANGIGCFRINSQILPLRTHPDAGYKLTELPDADGIAEAFRHCRRVASEAQVRLTFHPDQFVVLSSPKAPVVSSSLVELEHQAEVAEWVGADVITIHAGGAYEDKASALDRLQSSLRLLSKAARSRIALENDDRVYTPAELLPLCETEGVPLVYDVHHHRCLPDELSEETAARRAAATWNREPLFHISSPAGGWGALNPRIHDDYVSIRDFPRSWDDLAATVEVEARAKEVAVLRLQRALATRSTRSRGTRRVVAAENRGDCERPKTST